jgi:hypothetical protein
MFHHPASPFANAPLQTQSKQWSWVHGFVLLQFAFQILLLFSQFGVLRVPMRVGMFGLSLFLLVWLRGRGATHPAAGGAIAIMGIMLLSFCLNPGLNTLMAGLAQCALYLAILAPLFWVKRQQLTTDGFRWLILLMWGFQTISACFGVLQVYFPGKFQPFLSTAVQNSPYGGANLLITLANGVQVYRPMGLTDVPGGAATAGFYALLLGTGIALFERKIWLQLICIGSAAIGLFCIYLSQIRSILVLAMACLLCLMLVLAKQYRFGQLIMMGIATATIALTTFGWAIAVGGQETLKRLTTLVADRADAVYYQNRGIFLDHTLNELLPKYPLGAGLGRWGMMNNYFGTDSNPLSLPVWVEIQWTGWVVDGGIPLVFAYTATLILACYIAWKVAMNRKLGEFRLWGALIFSYNIGAIALTFNYPLFLSQGGMEFWLLNAALFTAAHWGEIESLQPHHPQWS